MPHPDETPHPSPATIFNEMPLIGGRISLAQKEVVRRLELGLPALIDSHNANENLKGKNLIPQADGYEIAPSFIADDGFLNKILVGVSVDTRALGIGGTYMGEIALVVYSVDKNIKTSQEVVVHWERAELIRGLLAHYIDGCIDNKGHRCWDVLEPGPYMIMPAEMAEDYSGTVCHFRMVQKPNTPGLWGASE